MSHYTAYLIARDRHHIKAVDLECVDDDAAKKRAEQMADVSNVELWSTPAELLSLTANLNEWIPNLVRLIVETFCTLFRPAAVAYVQDDQHTCNFQSRESFRRRLAAQMPLPRRQN